MSILTLQYGAQLPKNANFQYYIINFINVLIRYLKLTHTEKRQGKLILFNQV